MEKFENPEIVYKNELALIKSEDLRKFAIDCLLIAPKYIWTMSSSTTGKYHPANECSVGGQIIHNKKIIKLITHWCELSVIDEIHKDMMIVAGLLHDMVKAGDEEYDNPERWTKEEHPFWVRPLIEKYQIHTKYFNDTGLEKVYEPIMRAVEYHSGTWSPKDKIDLLKKYIIDYMKNDTQSYRIMIGLHVCDYLASRSDIDVEIFR